MRGPLDKRRVGRNQAKASPEGSAYPPYYNRSGISCKRGLPPRRASGTLDSRPAGIYHITAAGPSVLSWELEGRKASRLPIPAYRCLGAGKVRINITVDKQGNVTGAKVDEGSSSSDGCLRSFAVRAARMSKFSMSSTAPDRQQGFIIYQFVAQ